MLRREAYQSQLGPRHVIEQCRWLPEDEWPQWFSESRSLSSTTNIQAWNTVEPPLFELMDKRISKRMLHRFFLNELFYISRKIIYLYLQLKLYVVYEKIVYCKIRDPIFSATKLLYVYKEISK